jgi:hypothetical protein
MKRWLSLTSIICGLLSALAVPNLSADSRKPTNERLLVIHSAPAQKTKDTEQLSRANVYDGIVEHLTDKGYRVVDKASAEQCSIQIAATHDIDPVLNRAASFGLKFFAEYSVFFKTTTITKDRDDSKGALVKITAKVVDNTSCQVITSKSADASSGGLSLDDAIEKAGRAAGKKLAAALVDSLEKNLRESGGTGRTYTIVFECSECDANLLAMLTRLEQNSSVAAARETESGGGKTTLEVIYKGKRDQLDRDILKTAADLGWRTQKIRAEGNRSTWKIY